MTRQNGEFQSKFAYFLEENSKKFQVEGHLEALQKVRAQFCAKVMHPLHKEQYLKRLDYLMSHCQRQLNPYRQAEEKQKTKMKNSFLKKILKALGADEAESQFKNMLESPDIEVELALYLYQHRHEWQLEKIPSIAFNPARLSRARLQQVLDNQNKWLYKKIKEGKSKNGETQKIKQIKKIEQILAEIQDSVRQFLDD